MGAEAEAESHANAGYPILRARAVVSAFASIATATGVQSVQDAAGVSGMVASGWMDPVVDLRARRESIKGFGGDVTTELPNSKGIGRGNAIIESRLGGGGRGRGHG